jgi:hypothetical protein
MYRNARPILATAALRQLSPRKTIGTAFCSNMFASLRDVSPAPSVSSENDFRPRAQSVKRKNDDSQGLTYAMVSSGAGSGSDPADAIQIPSGFDTEKVTVEITKVKSLCSIVTDDLRKVDIPPEVACVLNNLCEAISGLSSVQETICHALGKQKTSQPKQAESGWVTIGNISKKQRPNDQRLLPEVTRSGEPWKPANPTIQVTSNPAQVDPAAKFKEAIKEAEKSTLVFNLDMGKVPIMNRETMNKKATLALTAMAAKKEKKTTSIPSEEAVMAIDDLLSVTTGIEFFGASTKSYSHPNDPNSGLFCTIPVKYEFKDKDDRVRAETTLRDRCDIKCTTPYPTMVRECIKQIISSVKAEQPDNLVKVTVDTGNLCFKVATKVKGGKDEKNPWVPYRCTVPIPPEAMDVSKRRVPDGFKCIIPKPQSPRKKSQTEVMEVTEPPAISPEGQS